MKYKLIKTIDAGVWGATTHPEGIILTLEGKYLTYLNPYTKRKHRIHYEILSDPISVEYFQEVEE